MPRRTGRPKAAEEGAAQEYWWYFEQRTDEAAWRRPRIVRRSINTSELWDWLTTSRTRGITSFVRRASIGLMTLLFAAPGAAHAAGAWTQPEGGYYLKLSDRSLFGAKAYDADAKLFELGDDFMDHVLLAYFEYGLTPDITLVASGAPVGYSSFGDESTIYVGTLRAGARHALFGPSIPVSAEATLGVAPGVGDDPLGAGRTGTVDWVIAPTVGQVFFDLEIAAGTSLPFGWLSASAGARVSSNPDLGPAVFGFAQIGGDTGFGLVGDLHVNLFESIDEIEVVNGLGAAKTRYLGLGVGLSYWFTQSFALALGLEVGPIAHANAGSPSITFGVELR